MKKIFIFISVFLLVSCWNNPEDFSSKKSVKNEKNIKNICDSIVVGENFSHIQKNFGEAELLSSQKSETGFIEVYLYGKIESEKCLISTLNGKVETVNYHK